MIFRRRKKTNTNKPLNLYWFELCGTPVPLSYRGLTNVVCKKKKIKKSDCYAVFEILFLSLFMGRLAPLPRPRYKQWHKLQLKCRLRLIFSTARGCRAESAVPLKLRERETKEFRVRESSKHFIEQVTNGDSRIESLFWESKEFFSCVCLCVCVCVRVFVCLYVCLSVWLSVCL